MSEFRVAPILALAGGLAMAAAAHAQKPPPFIEADSVTITAPKTIMQNRDGVTEQLVTMSVRVPYGDLDMKTAAGASALDKRVQQAADYVCDTLARRYPESDPEPF